MDSDRDTGHKLVTRVMIQIACVPMREILSRKMLTRHDFPKMFSAIGIEIPSEEGIWNETNN